MAFNIIDAPSPFPKAMSARAAARGFDPRTQFIALIAINAATFSSQAMAPQLAAVGLTLAALLWQRDYRRSIAFCLCYAGAVALLAASLAYPSPFTGVTAFLGIILCKGLPVFIFAAGVVARTPVGSLTAALQSARIPQPVIIVVAVTIRFFPTLWQEFGLVLDGLRMRGLAFTPLRLLRHPVMAVENVLVPLMVRMANISEEVAAVAVSRGMDSSRARVAYRALRPGIPDALLLIAALLLAVLAFWPGPGGNR
ncbi:MAG: energy-coupling factor transporter transmembrane component T [Pseudodesulfovibrio sp.]